MVQKYGNEMGWGIGWFMKSWIGDLVSFEYILKLAEEQHPYAYGTKLNHHISPLFNAVVGRVFFVAEYQFANKAG